MEIQKTQTGEVVTLAPKGRLDVITAPDMEKALADTFKAADEVVLDFAEVGYVSSAGLRVLLQGHKNAIADGKKMSLKNVSPEIMKIFDVTGFTKTLNIN